MQAVTAEAAELMYALFTYSNGGCFMLCVVASTAGR